MRESQIEGIGNEEVHGLLFPRGAVFEPREYLQELVLVEGILAVVMSEVSLPSLGEHSRKKWR